MKLSKPRVIQSRAFVGGAPMQYRSKTGTIIIDNSGHRMNMAAEVRVKVQRKH